MKKFFLLLWVCILFTFIQWSHLFHSQICLGLKRFTLPETSINDSASNHLQSYWDQCQIATFTTVITRSEPVGKRVPVRKAKHLNSTEATKNTKLPNRWSPAGSDKCFSERRKSYTENFLIAETHSRAACFNTLATSYWPYWKPHSTLKKDDRWRQLFSTYIEHPLPTSYRSPHLTESPSQLLGSLQSHGLIAFCRPLSCLNISIPLHHPPNPTPFNIHSEEKVGVVRIAKRLFKSEMLQKYLSRTSVAKPYLLLKLRESWIGTTDMPSPLQL